MTIYTAELDNEIEADESPKFSSGPSSVASDVRSLERIKDHLLSVPVSSFGQGVVRYAGLEDWDDAIFSATVTPVAHLTQHQLFFADPNEIAIPYVALLKQAYGLLGGRRYSSPLLEIWSEPNQDQELAAILQDAALSLPAAWRATLLARIAFLAEDSADEDDNEPLSMSSLRSAIHFLSSCPKLKLPSLFVAPNGNFRAEWHEAQQSLGIEFSTGYNARYVLLKPRPNSNVIERYSGYTTNDNVLAQLYPQGVTHWIREK